MADKRILLSGGQKMLPTRGDLEDKFFSFFQRNRSFSGPNQPKGKKGKKGKKPKKPTPVTPPPMGGGRPGGGGGGAPSFLTLPWTRHFEEDTRAQLPAGFSSGLIRGGHGGPLGLSEVQATFYQQFYSVPHANALFLDGSNPGNTTGVVVIDLGAPVDCSKGIRISHYARHYNESAGGTDAAEMFGPILSENGDNDANSGWLRMFNAAASWNRIDISWYQDDAVVLFDREEQWGLQGTEKWFVYERQIDFENGTAHIHAARGQSGGWPTIYTESHSFAPMAGPTNLRYLCLSGFGSSSGWKVYDHVQIAQVWIGSLDDAFPTRGQIWTV